jgi:hypothetical protein
MVIGYIIVAGSYRINRILRVHESRSKFTLIERLLVTGLNRPQNMSEFARMLILLFLMLLHVLDHLVDTWLFEVILPKLKYPLLTPLKSLLSQVLSCLPSVMAFKRVSQEIESL